MSGARWNFIKDIDLVKKCGERNSSTSYHRKSEVVNGIAYYNCGCGIFEEHMERICKNCGYNYGYNYAEKPLTSS